MESILPTIPGLDINGLLYKYTTVKKAKDDMKVHVGNRNANGKGYIFRETDNWSGVPGNTIVKSFRLSNIPAENWGRGSITVDGKGKVKDASVVYSYRIDECYNPQLNPSCPGYKKPIPQIPEYEIYSALDDDAVTNALNAEEFEYDEDGNIISEEDSEKKETRLEMGLTASANALTLFKTKSQAQIIAAMNLKTDLSVYYKSTLNGGILADASTLNGGNISDNKKGLRNNLAQQLLHEKMVNMQYNK
jgi:YD repeat-containing protein